MKIVKINQISSSYYYFNDKLLLKSVQAGHPASNNIEKLRGKLTISFKKGKKRFLLKGLIVSELTWSDMETKETYYFIPSNLEKFNKLLAPIGLPKGELP